ncbi:flagellar biosynthesis protein FlhB [Rhizobacter sp. Root404]|uniref:EscU/YscU/HrcU family type III secretion system export apparatus switch protein n=1 Tax=Rhizobacter sp. Root404 TaxID=1736528 RepID=UPI0006FE1F05|nr:flagellar type III secretion system protein FlhB [Rhizobacter sp. Root404]KQW40437.1 flagellar biosynthetic protein FlhB [Rhizobacter sp. Root404]
MSEQSSQDRNLPASQRKLKKAREDGQVARSRDLGHFVAIAACGALLVAAAPFAADWLKQTLMQGLQFDRGMLQNPGAMGERLQALTIRMMWIVVPFGLAMMAAAMASSLAIGGWNWTLKPLMPNFGKLNPITGLPGILSKQKLVDALKGSVLALILGGIGGLFLKGHVDQFAGLLALPLPAAIQQTAASMVGGVGLLLIALGVFAMIDVPLQRFQLAQKLKMSHQEQKQEHKELEGNQEIKAKVRARMREMTRRRMMAAVPGADLVVMNPTHYAVALKYDDKKMGAPRVVAKGADLIAMAIRDLAKDSKVPVLQAPVLARALYAHAELDREIPAALFGAVAQVLAYVYQLRAALAGQVAMPNALPDLDVPAELDPHNKPVPGMDAFD